MSGWLSHALRADIPGYLRVPRRPLLAGVKARMNQTAPEWPNDPATRERHFYAGLRAAQTETAMTGQEANRG